MDNGFLEECIASGAEKRAQTRRCEAVPTPCNKEFAVTAEDIKSTRKKSKKRRMEEEEEEEVQTKTAVVVPDYSGPPVEKAATATTSKTKGENRHLITES